MYYFSLENFLAFFEAPRHYARHIRHPYLVKLRIIINETHQGQCGALKGYQGHDLIGRVPFLVQVESRVHFSMLRKIPRIPVSAWLNYYCTHFLM